MRIAPQAPLASLSSDSRSGPKRLMRSDDRSWADGHRPPNRPAPHPRLVKSTIHQRSTARHEQAFHTRHTIDDVAAVSRHRRQAAAELGDRRRLEQRKLSPHFVGQFAQRLEVQGEILDLKVRAANDAYPVGVDLARIRPASAPPFRAHVHVDVEHAHDGLRGVDSGDWLGDVKLVASRNDRDTDTGHVRDQRPMRRQRRRPRGRDLSSSVNTRSTA